MTRRTFMIEAERDSARWPHIFIARVSAKNRRKPHAGADAGAKAFTRAESCAPIGAHQKDVDMQMAGRAL